MKHFDVYRLVAQHNQHHSSYRIKPKKTWGFAYLSAEGLGVLNSSVAIINDINQSQSYRTQIKNLGNYRQSLKVLKQSKPSPDFFHQARKLCRTASKLFTFNKVRSWEAEQIAWLNDVSNWERLISNNSEAKGSLIKLKQFWDRQKVFCRCSNDFLIQAMEALQEPEQQLALAEKELLKKRHRLPVFIAENYSSFLGELRKELQQTKEALLNTMISRVAVCGMMFTSTGHLHCDDTLVYTITELQRFGALKSTMHLSGYWQTLEPKHFNGFNQFLQQEGTQYHVKELLRLPWFDENKGVIETKNVMVGNQCCVIPTSLTKCVPTRKRRPTWLFQSNHRCIDFIQQQQVTFANLKLGFPTIRSVEPKERFQRIEQYEQQLQLAGAESHKYKPRYWQLWSYFGYRELLDEYKVLLNKQSQYCLHERIKLLEEIAYLEVPPKNHEGRYKLWLMVREQISRLNSRTLPKELQTRVNTVERSLSEILQQEPSVYATCLLQALADNRLLHSEELEYIIEYIEINDLSPEKNHWLDSIKPFQTQAVSSLLRQLKQLFSKQETSLTSTILLNYIKLIQSLSDSDDQISLQVAIKQMLSTQTKWLCNEKEASARLRLSCIQKLVHELGDQETKDWLNNITTHNSDISWPDFVEKWRAHISELESDNNTLQHRNDALLCNSQRGVSNDFSLRTRKSFFSFFGQQLPVGKELSTSAPSGSNHASLLLMRT